MCGRILFLMTDLLPMTCVLLYITVQIRSMWCEDIIQQNIERSDDQFAIEERVHRHQGDLRKTNRTNGEEGERL